MCRTPTTGACGPSTVRTPPPPRSRRRPAAPARRSDPGPPGGARGRRGGARRAARPGRAQAGRCLRRGPPPASPAPSPAAGEPRAPFGGQAPGQPAAGARGSAAPAAPQHPAGGSRLSRRRVLPPAVPVSPRDVCAGSCRGDRPRLPSPRGGERQLGRAGWGVSPRSGSPRRARGKARRGERSAVLAGPGRRRALCRFSRAG